MRSNIDSDVCLSKVVQHRDELNDLGDALTDERLKTIILDALPEEMHSAVKMQSIRDRDLGLGAIIRMMKTVVINHSEESSVPKRRQELYRKVWNSGRESRTDNERESTMTLTCHNCKKPGHEKKDCKELMGKSD